MLSASGLIQEPAFSLFLFLALPLKIHKWWSLALTYEFAAIANGVFFNLGARLARYTGNQTYSNWASVTWDWLTHVNMINNQSYQVFDGAHVELNCTDVNQAQFSYNSAIYMQGCAYMYNFVSLTKYYLAASKSTIHPVPSLFLMSCILCWR